MGNYNHNFDNRKSHRLPGFDYSLPGYYFVTILVKDRQHLFGSIRNGHPHLSEVGNVAEQCWQEIPEHYPTVKLDEYIIMPNHVHGIIQIIARSKGEAYVRAENLQPLHRRDGKQKHKFQQVIPKSLSAIVRGYKIGVTNWCRNNGHDYFQWHRNFHDHIIESKEELYQIRNYIRNNPKRWEEGEDDLQ